MRLNVKATVLIASLASTFLPPLQAEAHSVPSRHRGSHWEVPDLRLELTSGQIVIPFCNGKYEDVAAELNRENLLGQINLYRINAGLPKLQTKTHERFYRGYGRHTRKDTRLRDAKLLLERAQTHLSPGAERDYIRALDLSTSSGPVFDWWLRADQIEESTVGCVTQLNGGRGLEVLCNAQREHAEIIKTSAAYEWLMTDHQMQRAETSWMGFGYFHKDQMENIFDHIDKQVSLRPSLNIWMTQYEHHKLFDHDLPVDVTRIANETVSNILTCQASAAEYGIIALGDLGLPHSYLPRVLAERRAQRDIHTLTYKAITQGSGLDLAYHMQLRAMTERLERKIWASSLLFLSAPDLNSAYALYEEAKSFEENSSYHSYQWQHGYRAIERLFFALKTEDIPVGFKRLQLAHALSEGKIEIGSRIAPDVRAQAQAELEKEKADLRKIIDSYKGGNTAYLNQLNFALKKLERRGAVNHIGAIQSADISAEIKLTLTAIFSNASQNIDMHHRDIYSEQSNERFFDIFLRKQLFPASLYPYFTGRSRSYYSIPETYLNGEHTDSLAFDIPSLRKNDGTPEVGFAALVDWEKLESIGDEKRLTRTLALNIFNWVDQSSSEARKKNAHLIAPALYDIIRICRHEDAGNYQGAPLQQRAFERLHTFYGHTDSAKNTPYWWPSRPQHGNAPL